MNISKFSIKRPVFTIVSMIFVLILGAVSLFKIPITLIPDLNPPIGVVVTSYPGASPIEVNEKVTKPLEASLATLPGIKRVQSTSLESSNLIILEFDWSTKMDDVQTEDRKSTRLNSSHVKISYAVFCLKKKKKNTMKTRAQ